MNVGSVCSIARGVGTSSVLLYSVVYSVVYCDPINDCCRLGSAGVSIQPPGISESRGVGRGLGSMLTGAGAPDAGSARWLEWGSRL
jgi:hypothetical protein